MIWTKKKTVLWTMLHVFCWLISLSSRNIYWLFKNYIFFISNYNQDGPWFKSRLCQEASWYGVCMFSQCWYECFGPPYNSNTCRIGELETLIMNFVNAYDQIHVTRCDSLQVFFLKMVRIWYVICYILCKIFKAISKIDLFIHYQLAFIL